MTTTEIRVGVPPREDVLRTSPFALRAADDGGPGDGLTLDGYAATFKRRTKIDSWEGRFWEEIAAGSMQKSFRESPPKIQFDHGRHPLIGSIPIAQLDSIREDTDPDLAPDGGAHVVGRLLDNWLIQPVREAIANRSVDGMSFRFTVVREQWAEADGKVVRDEEKLRELLRRSWYEEVPDEELLTRTLKEVRVPELGPVVWPAYAETSVGVRSMLDRLSDSERRALFEHAKDLTGTGARSANAGDPSGTQPGKGERPTVPTRSRVDNDALRLRGIL